MQLDSALGRYLDDLGVWDPAAAAAAASRGSPSAGLGEGFVYDVVELFAGSDCSSFSAAVEEDGWRALRLGLATGFDLRGRVARPVMVGLVLRRVVRVWQLAPPCTRFGTLRRPRDRSREQPAGFAPQDPDVLGATQRALFAGSVLALAAAHGASGLLEQPRGSVMRHLQLIQRLNRGGIHDATFPFCGYGSPFQKA